MIPEVPTFQRNLPPTSSGQKRFHPLKKSIPSIYKGMRATMERKYNFTLFVF
jgi:hypothetical protein